MSHRQKRCPVQQQRDLALALSEEQRILVDALECPGAPVGIIADCVAGSGKTTVALALAQRYPDRDFLLIPYNARLKSEVRCKAQQLGISNLQVHNYHAVCCKHLHRSCHTDAKIVLRLSDVPVPRFSGVRFDVLVLDEVQDMTHLYYEVTMCLLRDNEKTAAHRVSVVLLGDTHQCIYYYNGADSRFLSHGDRLFDLLPTDSTYRYTSAGAAPEDLHRHHPPRKWMRMTLSQSFRVTPNIADFVNRHLANGTRRIHSAVAVVGDSVRYVICNPYDPHQACAEVLHYIRDRGYLPGDIFVLSPSVRPGKRGRATPVSIMVDRLAPRGVRCYVPTSSDGALNEDAMASKVAFSTFHQSKGLQRKVAIVLGFDDSFYRFYSTSDTPTHLRNNPLYVACTRASHALSVVQSVHCLPILDVTQLRSESTTDSPGGGSPLVVDYAAAAEGTDDASAQSRQVQYGTSSVAVRSTTEFSSEEVQTVTDLLRHLPHRVVANCLKHMHVSEARIPGCPALCLPTSAYGEPVSDINGIAILAAYETARTTAGNSCALLDRLRQMALDKVWSRIPTESLCAEFMSLVLGAPPSHRPGNKPGTPPAIRHTQDDSSSKRSPLTASQALLISNVFIALSSGFWHRVHQIPAYDWITQQQLQRCFDSLDAAVQPLGGDTATAPLHCRFEQALRAPGICGRVDIINDRHLWEVKCTSGGASEAHILQLALYAHMAMEMGLDITQFSIFSVTTGTAYHLRVSREDCRYIAHEIQLSKVPRPPPTANAVADTKGTEDEKEWNYPQDFCVRCASTRAKVLYGTTLRSTHSTNSNPQRPTQTIDEPQTQRDESTATKPPPAPQNYVEARPHHPESA
jgi:hypothetical protein